MLIKRRDFIKLVGGIGGAAVLGGFALDEMIEVPERLVEAARNGPGIETWKNTICRQCPGGCGVRVRLVDGVPVSIKGNPQYPVNKGGMCQKGFSGLQVLFNPDRVSSPLRRIGLHGQGTWEPLSWDQALSTVANALAQLRSGGKAHEMVFLGADESDVMSDHISRFMQAYGSPNYFCLSLTTNDTVPYLLTEGVARVPAYDLLNARYVLSFGSNFLEEGYSPVYYTKLFSGLRDAATGRRTEFVSVDTRLHLTAANADRWIPIRPGTYGALALGLAYVLIREELYDADFVARHTYGFEDSTDAEGQTRLGFKSLVLGGYYPERVEEITGASAETIVEIGRDLGNTRPSVVLAGQSAADHSNGTYAYAAIHSLNALLGNFESEGGTVNVDAVPFTALNPVVQDDLATEGRKQDHVARPQNAGYPVSNFAIDSFVENVLSGKPYPVSVLFIHGGNPLFRALNHRRFAEALKRIPLTVSFDPFINETSEYADLILPDHTFLEKWDAVANTPSVPFTHVGIQQPIVEPFHDTRHTADVLTDIGQHLGGSVAESLPQVAFEKVVRKRLGGVFKSGEGAVVSEGVQQSWLEYLQQRGWHIGRYSSFGQFWRLLIENGGWWNPIRRRRSWSEVFRTPSGRFEFYSQILEQSIDALLDDASGRDSQHQFERILTDLHISARGATVFMPHFEPPFEMDEGMPLYLTTFQTPANHDGHGANQPLMQEMFGYAVRRYWRTWAELHPDTAAAHGVHDGDWIWVESAMGSIRVQAVVHPGILPNAIAIPFGLGHSSYGRYAAGYGANPNSIMRNAYDMVSGRPALQSTRVRIAIAT